MRCFIAIDLPEEIKDYLFSLQKEFDNDLVRVKWVPKSQIHLTLKFLGEVDEDKLEKTKTELKEIKAKKFLVSLGKIGLFPSEDYVRVIWVGIEPSKDVVELQKAVDFRLLDLFRAEQRFEAHLTLGRVKFIKDKEGLKRMLKNIKIKSLEFYVDNFKLMQSTLTGNGPVYNVLNKYVLD